MLLGIAIGVIGAWGPSGLLRGFLFEVQPHDPRVYAGALLVLATTKNRYSKRNRSEA
jgi:hypothetical protein